MNHLKPMEYQNQRILLTSQIAEMYGTNPEVITKNYNRNKERYSLAKDFYCLEGEMLRAFRANGQIDLLPNLNKLYLWTEHGALLHAKSLGTDRAWEVYGELVDTYFRIESKTVLPIDYPSALRALANEVERKAALAVENTQQKQLIGELKPKADYLDQILSSKSLVTITQISKDYGMSGKEMNRKLHELGVQYKQSGQWLLYSKYHDCGYTHSETVDIEHSDGRSDVVMNTKWTQKGRLFLYNLLKQNRILPVIERHFAS